MSILAARSQKHVPLHDHQFAFRKSRGSELYSPCSRSYVAEQNRAATYAFHYGKV
jgi:hypothetical protein